MNSLFIHFNFLFTVEVPFKFYLKIFHFLRYHQIVNCLSLFSWLLSEVFYDKNKIMIWYFSRLYLSPFHFYFLFQWSVFVYNKKKGWNLENQIQKYVAERTKYNKFNFISKQGVLNNRIEARHYQENNIN